MWCRLVTYDEGLRSYKAIAFIESLTKTYCKLGATPQRNVLSKTKTPEYSLNVMVKMLWIN